MAVGNTQYKNEHAKGKMAHRNFTTKEMISIFPLWTFHLDLATFQHHLHMEYTMFSWYEIPDLVIPIRISLIESCC